MDTALAQIPPAEARQQVQQGRARLLDIRNFPAFLGGHATGSLNVPYIPGDFPSLVAHLLPPGAPAILTADHDAVVEAAADVLRSAGHEVAGALAGGFAGWLQAGLPTQRMEELDPAAVQERLAQGGIRVIDVRNPDEWAEGVIAGAAKIPLPTLADRLGELDPAADYVTVCAHGRRSQQAAWLMLQRGFGKVTSLVGGMAAWQEEGLPTE